MHSTTEYQKCIETSKMTNGAFLMPGSQSLQVIWMRAAQWLGSGKSLNTGKYREVGRESRVENKANESN